MYSRVPQFLQFFSRSRNERVPVLVVGILSKGEELVSSKVNQNFTLETNQGMTALFDNTGNELRTNPFLSEEVVQKETGHVAVSFRELRFDQG